MLEIIGVSKNFESVRALDNLSFEVLPGEIMGFVGANGAGKSTLMRIILGVLLADSGTVLYDGKPIGYEMRKHIGYMPEERGLYPRMKVGEQIFYFARLHGLSAQESREAVEKWATVLKLKNRLNEETQKLSLGNQQRVQIAVSIVHNPKLLVLDEPFSGLDPVAVDVMASLLKEQAERGVPTLFSSHQLDLVERLSDRTTIISAGKLVAKGSVAELRKVKLPTYIVRPAVLTKNVENPESNFVDEAAHKLSGNGSSIMGMSGGSTANKEACVVLQRKLLELPGVTKTSISQDSESSFVKVEIAQDDVLVVQAILAEAQKYALLREFVIYRPSLAEIFTGVVSTENNLENEEDKHQAGYRSGGFRWGKAKKRELTTTATPTTTYPLAGKTRRFTKGF